MYRILNLLIPLILLMSAHAYASSDNGRLEQKIKNNEQRIERLERLVESLEDRLNEYEGSASTKPVDQGFFRSRRIVGSWECTNNVYEYDIHFYADGTLMQEEPFLGSTKSSQWSNLSGNRFMTERGRVFEADFSSENEFTAMNTNTKEEWRCYRK